MDIAVFLIVTRDNFVEVYRRFEETCCVHHKSKGRFTHSMQYHVAPMPVPCHAVPLRLRTCLSNLIYKVRPCLIHTCYAMPMSLFDHAVLFKATAKHGRRETVVLCCGLEKNGMVGSWHGHGMERVNQSRPHCVNQMGKTRSKPLAARHGRRTAWERHTMCESAFRVEFAEDRKTGYPNFPPLL